MNRTYFSGMMSTHLRAPEERDTDAGSASIIVKQRKQQGMRTKEERRKEREGGVEGDHKINEREKHRDSRAEPAPKQREEDCLRK